MKKSKKSDKSSIASAKTNSSGKKKYFLIVLAALIVVSIISLAVWNKAGVEQVQSNIISLQDKQRLGELALKVASNPGNLKEVYHRFWNILEKYSLISGSQLTLLKKDMRELFYLPKLFLEDAGKTVKNQIPFKSIEREKLEKRFIEKGFLKEQQIQDDEETMRLIASRKALKASHGLEIIVEEMRIAEMLQNWNDKEIERIINRLFTPLEGPARQK